MLPPLFITVWRFTPSLSVSLSLSLSHMQKAFSSSQLVSGSAHLCRDITHTNHANAHISLGLSLSLSH